MCQKLPGEGVNDFARTHYERSTAEHEYTYQTEGSTINHYTINNTGSIMVFTGGPSPAFLFDFLRKQTDGLADAEKIKAAIDDMERARGKSNFAEKYNALIQSIANHMAIFSPCISMLTALLGNS